MGRNRRGVWDESLPGSGERRGQGVKRSGRREVRNGRGGQPAGRGAASQGERRDPGKCHGSQGLASEGP